jgi:hypothetical protein
MRDQGRGVRACRLLRARARGDGTGRKRGAEINWPSVCLSPAAGSHGNGSICVSHANTGVHSNMSDVSVQATVSFIITFLKRTSLRQALSRRCRALVRKRHPKILNDVRIEQRPMMHDLPPGAGSVDARPRMDGDTRWWPRRRQDGRWPTWDRERALSERRRRQHQH